MQRRDLPLEFVRVVEMAAIASAQTMGQGDRKHSDQVAVEAMRREIESVDIDGTLPRGVRSFGDRLRTQCVIMTTKPQQVRFIDASMPARALPRGLDFEDFIGL